MWGALYKKELSSFFYNYSAFFILFFYMLLSLVFAVFVGMYLVEPDRTLFLYFTEQPAVLIMVVPAVTMHLWAEEAKSGTQEVLWTFPIGNFTLVSAKFAAGWTMALLMLVVSSPLVAARVAVVETDLLAGMSAYVGTLLVAGVVTAFGCLVSICVPLPLVAYLISFVSFTFFMVISLKPLLLYWLGSLSNVPFYVPEAFDFMSHYRSFLNGRPGPDDIFYFVSLILLLLGFNWLVLTAKRSGR